MRIERTIKNLQNYYHKLVDMVLLTHSLFPTQKTKNPYMRLIRNHVEDQETLFLFQQLSHSLTLLHQVNRYKNKHGEYLTEKEDVLASLYLLQHRLNKNLMITKSEQELYHFLKKRHKGPFTRKQVQDALDQSKSHTHRQLEKLLYTGKIERIGGYKNRGYVYALKKANMNEIRNNSP